MFDEVGEPDDPYMQVIVTVAERAPLLADPRLARIAAGVLRACGPAAPGRLWGYLVLPDTLRWIAGPAAESAHEVFSDQVKARTEQALLAAIRRASDDSLDVVLRYNPVWGGAIYRVWEAGYHRAAFRTEYRLSNAVFELIQAPVALGLVERPGEWPYVWTGS